MLEWALADGVPVSGAGSTSKSSQTIYIRGGNDFKKYFDEQFSSCQVT